MFSEEVVLFSTLAVRGALERRLVPMLPEDLRPRLVFDPTAVLLERIALGERPDVIVAVSEDVERLHLEGHVHAGVPLGRTEVGIGVAAGRRHANVGTTAELTRELLGARSVAYSRSGASGKHFVTVLYELGIADEVNRRATIVDKGFTGLALLDGRADLAVQQVSELMFVEGVEVCGPLPADVQRYTTFSAACWINAPSDAQRLLQRLVGSEARMAYAHAGLKV